MDSFLFPLQGGDTGIIQTVAHIKLAVYSSLRAPAQLIRRRAESLIRNLSIRERDETSEIVSMGRFVQDHFHYVHDPSGIEYVKSPEVVDKEVTDYNSFIGDCDDAAAYLAALLKSIGYKVNLTIMAAPRNPQQTFSHIYVQAYSPKRGRWISLDMTAKGKPLGWNPLSSRFRSYDV